MRLIIATEPGIVELNYMWMPTFLGLDGNLKQYIEDELGPLLVGKDLSSELLDWANEKVMDLICMKYEGLEGLRDYLDSIKFVSL